LARALVDRTPADDVAALVLPTLSGSVWTPSRMEESAGLVEALGVRCAFAEPINIREPSPSRLFGSGQLAMLGERLKENGATLLIVDAALTPVQQRNLESDLHLKVVDRTGLILEIFGLRARTAEGRLQVEMARSLYERSRLVRTWTHLERQRGGFGFLGGPGETQLEADRRMLDKRIAGFRRQLEDVRRTRRLQREGRARRGAPVISLVGYTNAGKSTLFNRLSGAQVLAADMPFATLDPTTREIETEGGRRMALVDTVGFITDLPTHLVAAFRATLEEAMEADLLIHVRDIAHPETETQAEDVYGILNQLAEASTTELPPVLEAWNKYDLLEPAMRASLERRLPTGAHAAIAVSALTGEGVSDLLRTAEAMIFSRRRLRSIQLGVVDGRLRAWLHANADVASEAPSEDGAWTLLVRMSEADVARFASVAPGVPVSDAEAGQPGSAPLAPDA
jgi:GTPase